jgi:hypothetical protein
MRSTFSRLGSVWGSAMRCQLSLVVLQLVPLCYGQPVGLVPDAPNPAPVRTVTGIVTNAVSGVPIRHALVQASGIVPAPVLTGPDGRFRFDNIPEGQVLISVQKPGYFDANSIPGYSQRQVNPFATVGSGKNDFRIALYPAARIVGRVTDADDEPAENISVQVLSEQIVQGRKLLVPQNGGTTDDDGFYRIDGLIPGRYKIFANGHLLPASSWNAPPEVSVPAYYPYSRDLASAQKIELKAAEEYRADFHLHSEPGFRVVAAVGGLPNSPNVGFSLENASGQNVMFGVMNFDTRKGQFTAQAVPSGAWTLVFSANDGQASSYEAREEIMVDRADVTDLQFTMHPLASIPVKVNHGDNKGQPETQGADTALNASLNSVEPSRYFTYGLQVQGSPPLVTFSNVAAGKYKLNVQSLGSECLESAWYGSVDLTRDYLVVGSNVDPQTLTINLRGDCATLNVKLQPGDQPRIGLVLIVGSSPIAEPETMPVQAPTPTQRENVSMPFTLSPGSYQVYAFSSVAGLEYANPEVLRGYASQTVNLEPGQKAELTLELIEPKGN